jgi:pyruvate kinase
MQNLEAIIIESDTIMFALSDLYVKYTLVKYQIQKKVVSLCSFYERPIIIATQMVI